MNGLMTEREWRRQARCPTRGRPDWWGAQYLLPAAKRKGLRDDAAFRLFLVLLALVTAVLLPLLVPARQRECFVELGVMSGEEGPSPRSVSAVRYSLPADLRLQKHTCTYAELAQGKLLLLDEAHPLPRDTLPPNTFSIATQGRGMVPVAQLSLKSGRETIQALEELFGALRAKGVGGLLVWRGTTSAAQQRQERLQCLRSLLRRLPLNDARAETLLKTETPASGELLQEYAVELRFRGEGNEPDSRPLEATEKGQILLQTAWRYGFVRSAPQAGGSFSYRFRYVGRAHATAMTYLDLSLADYLEWLHQRGVMTVAEEGRVKYLILCQPVSGIHLEFSLPVGAQIEASLDNLGYAVVACTMP